VITNMSCLILSLKTIGILNVTRKNKQLRLEQKKRLLSMNKNKFVGTMALAVQKLLLICSGVCNIRTWLNSSFKSEQKLHSLLICI
jgi:hypothetical protein